MTGRLKNLKELNVRFNRLKSIPPELGDCENLEKLDCFGNLELTELPFEVRKKHVCTMIYFYLVYDMERSVTWGRILKDEIHFYLYHFSRHFNHPKPAIIKSLKMFLHSATTWI